MAGQILSSEGAAAERPGHRRLLIIYNPTAGRRRKRRLEAVVSALLALGCTVTIRATSAPGDARRLAAEADAGRFDALVAAGGDGTINEVLNGLVDPELPLALLPLGTSNVLAAEIGLESEPQQVARTIAWGRPRRVSIGVANGRRFAIMVGVGFDAHVVDTVDLRLKRWLGRMAYGLAILRQLRRFGFPRYTVRVDGVDWPAASVIVANARHYGGPFVCAPDAGLDDPAFRVCLFERSSRLAATGYALALFAGLLPRLASYRILAAARVEITGPPADPVQGDGDVIARLAVTIERLPNALSLIGPDDSRAPTCPGRPLVATVAGGAA